MEDKIYFKAGEIVTVKQDIPNKPKMYVVKVEKRTFKPNFKMLKDVDDLLIGIRCRWFTSDGFLQESIFNTKDLEKL